MEESILISDEVVARIKALKVEGVQGFRCMAVGCLYKHS